MQIVLYLAAIFLLPVIPAYVLYKTFPSNTIVKGPFKGLDINLSGAFAGYFLLVLIAVGMVIQAPSEEPDHYEIWKINGNVGSRSVRISPFTGDTTIKIDASGINLEIRPAPSEFKIDSDGGFEVNVLVKPGHVEGIRDFPTLIFKRSGYKSIIKNLNNIKKITNEDGKVLILTEVLFLEKLTKDTVTIL
ncbi:MAG: hypothetical protein IH950_03690 [Bacteroidetes bacterium]|nr:hypothetical protein [Bacteroidota bacterium]